ncbi:MAG: MazG-like family protein [Candidatus Syntrophoarchaeum sp.]|nr:MazG-like family protein [Candidatus Syntrophoarchaeum sp.]
MTVLNETERKVLNWANRRGLIEGTTAEKQVIKLMEEVGELSEAVLCNNFAETVDAIGDCAVVLTNLAAKLGVSLAYCYETAYNTIKNRTGKIINGTFVKNR